MESSVLLHGRKRQGPPAGFETGGRIPAFFSRVLFPNRDRSRLLEPVPDKRADF